MKLKNIIQSAFDSSTVECNVIWNNENEVTIIGDEPDEMIELFYCIVQIGSDWGIQYDYSLEFNSDTIRIKPLVS